VPVLASETSLSTVRCLLLAHAQRFLLLPTACYFDLLSVAAVLWVDGGDRGL
jgi:hypothetical protein